MKTNSTYKIAVLTDLSSSADQTLKSAVNLSKLLNGHIDLYYAKSSNGIAKFENQMSSLRALNEAYTDTKIQLSELAKRMSKTEGVNINYTFSVGQVKREIKDYLTQTQPDIVVLGKKKQKLVNGFGDGITKFVLKHHKGGVMISSPYNMMEQDLTLGMVNTNLELLNTPLAKHLTTMSSSPLKSFVIGNQKSTSSKSEHNVETIEYVFEDGPNSIKTVSNYVNKNNIKLLYMEKAKALGKGIRSLTPDFNTMISKINAPILVLGERH
ncbi:MAG: universal stress protein [Bacteroidota bacterium]